MVGEPHILRTKQLNMKSQPSVTAKNTKTFDGFLLMWKTFASHLENEDTKKSEINC